MTLACRYESKNQPTLPPKSKRKILLITVLGETTVTNNLCPTVEKKPGQEANNTIRNNSTLSTTPCHHKWTKYTKYTPTRDGEWIEKKVRLRTFIPQTKPSPSRIQSTSNKPSGSNPSVNDKKKHGTLAYSKVRNLAEKRKPLSLQTKPSPSPIPHTLNKPSGSNGSSHNRKKEGTLPNGKVPKTTDKVETSILKTGRPSPPSNIHPSNKPSGSNSSSYPLNSDAETEEESKDMEDESSISTHIEVDSVSLSPSPNFETEDHIEPALTPVENPTPKQVADKIALSMFILYGSRAPSSMLDKVAEDMQKLATESTIANDRSCMPKRFKDAINDSKDAPWKYLDRIGYEKLRKNLFTQVMISTAVRWAKGAKKAIDRAVDKEDSVRDELNKAYPNLIPTLFPPRKGGKTRKLVNILKILIALSGEGESTF